MQTSVQQAEIEIRSDKEGVMMVGFTGVVTKIMTCVIIKKKSNTQIIDNVNISSNR